MSLLLALQNLYPLGLSFSGFWRANYSASPWVGLATAGASGGRNLTEGTNPPTTGTAQNGYTPAAFDGVNDRLSYVGAEDIIGDNTGWTYHGVWKFGSLDAPSGAAINDPCIFALGPFSAAVALSVNSNGIALVQYDLGGTPYETTRVSVSTGQYYRIQARWNASTGIIWLRVDAGTPVTVSGVADIADASAENLIVGANYDLTAFLDAECLETDWLAYAETDVELDALDAYSVARYALGPATSDLSATCTTALTVVPIVRGTGTVASTVTTTLTLAPVVRGTGAVSSVCTTSLTNAAILSGRGDMAPTVTTALTVAPIVRGTGAVSATCTTTLTLAALLGGRGDIASTCTTALTSTAILGGRGDLAAAVTTTLTCSAIVVAAGSPDMACAVTTSLAVSAILSGRGAVAATCTTALTLAPIVRGRGDLAAIATTTLTASALLGGAGRVSAACTTTLTTQATMQAGASFSAACTTALTCSALLGGRGGVSAACGTALTLDASLFGFGDLSASVTTELTVSATFEIPPVTDVVLFSASSPGEVTYARASSGNVVTSGVSPGEVATRVASSG